MLEIIKNLEIGTSVDWKFGLITRDVLRVSDNIFVISDTSGGWVEARVNLETIEKLFNGEMSLLELNWR